MPHQMLAPNSTSQHTEDAYHGADHGKLSKQSMPNTRMHDYVANSYAGPGSHKGVVKSKGHTEHSKQEDEVGNDYGA